MKTENIGITNNPYNNANAMKNTKPGKVFDKSVADIYKAPVDRYTPSEVGAADPAKIESLWKETDQMGEALRKLIRSALGIEDAGGQGFWAKKAQNVNFNLSEAEKKQAEDLISEDGYFGVNKTTERLMSFAKALVGEDASEDKIELMRKAVQKGFDDVAKLFGGFDKLPDVTKKTYEAVMKAFDDWKNGGAAETETELE